jgi:hypothetical protein
MSGDAHDCGENMSRRISLPRSSDLQTAFEELYRLFPDLSPRLVDDIGDESRWTFVLEWPSDDRHFVDPDVAAAVSGLWSIEVPRIAGFQQINDRGGVSVVFSLVHAWALLSPALATRQPIAWVIHVDDHTDLMPVLGHPAATGVFVDFEKGQPVRLDEREGVVQAIESGIVNKGNFLTAYLLTHPAARVVHVDGNAGIDEHAVLKERRSTIEFLNSAVTGFDRVPTPRDSTWTWMRTNRLPEQLPSDGFVWLDVDLDYFCNRLDGDSDRQCVTASDAEREIVDRRLAGFSEQLQHAQWLNDVAAVSVAVSPGFTPSEYWDRAIKGVMTAIYEAIDNKRPVRDAAR